MNNIHLSQVELRVENIGQDGVSEDDTSSVVSEIPPPLTPGREIALFRQLFVWVENTES